MAYWIGPTTAAVLHIRHIREPVDEQDLDRREEMFIETDIDLFGRVDDAWQGWGGGGGAWADHLPLARVDVPPGSANLHGMNSASIGDRGCKALWGEVGTEAAFAEVIQSDQVTRRAVQAPTGAYVVCGEYDHPFTVRILNSQDVPLAEVEEPVGFKL